MHMQPLPEDMRVHSDQALSRRIAPQPRPDAAVPTSEWQECAALEETLELIEMRYQEHRALMDLHALFPEGGIGCL